MPVQKLVQQKSADHDRLTRELLMEWSQPNAASAEPVILEETDSQQQLAHVYVIWSEWNKLDRVERSEIIMDAAQAKLGAQRALNITIAMGLTPDEGKQMGLKW